MTFEKRSITNGWTILLAKGDGRCFQRSQVDNEGFRKQMAVNKKFRIV